MKYLAIIATRDFYESWKIAGSDFWEFQSESLNRKLMIWQKDDELSFSDYSDLIVQKINHSEDFELGVIFHKLNGDTEAASIKERLIITVDDKLAFCDWYSSIRQGFWNGQNASATSPYNNLQRAWKDNNGNKADAFEEVWGYFNKSNITNLNYEIQTWLSRLDALEYKKAKLVTNELIEDFISERDKILNRLQNI